LSEVTGHPTTRAKNALKQGGKIKVAIDGREVKAISTGRDFDIFEF
jgi:hypothetical protein